MSAVQISSIVKKYGGGSTNGPPYAMSSLYATTATTLQSYPAIGARLDAATFSASNAL